MPAGTPGWWEGLTLYARGALMGFADVIPGISGGTVALIVGVYERLILGLSGLFAVPGRLLRSGVTGGWRAVREVPWFFLVSLGLGIASALVVGANLIPPLYERYTMHANALFFGLILGSVAVPWHRIMKPSSRLVAVAGVAAIVVFLLVGLGEREPVSPPGWLVFGGAVIAISAMVLPGISGSYLLHVMGIWVPTLDAVREFDLGYLALFALGALTGAIFIVMLVSWLLRHHHDVTLAVLVGFMVGALRALWPWLDDAGRAALPEPGLGTLVLPVLLILAGFVLVRGIDAWGRRRGTTKRIGPG